jgi:hypothetical protein
MYVNAEVAPEYCPNGHQLGPNRVLVGWQPGDPGWRTHSCLKCAATIRTPYNQIEHTWIETGTNPRPGRVQLMRASPRSPHPPL